MAKWMCDHCGQIANEPIKHYAVRIAPDWEEESCGPWINVTHVYRAGQEAFRKGVMQEKPEPPDQVVVLELWSDRIYALRLEGDDDG